MQVIVWGINYAPEITGISPYNVVLCEHLHKEGHGVRMVTSFAYYPAWKKAPEDRGRLYRTDVINGVPVHRCWHYVPARVSSLKRMVHEGTFLFFSFLRLLSLPKPDVYVLVSPPLLLGPAGWLLGRLKGRPFIFHVQDLQPDAAMGLGMLKPSLFTKLLYGIEAFTYRKAIRVSGISRGMMRAFERKAVPSGKVVRFPNGVKSADPGSQPAAGQFRAKYGFAADEFLVVYGGNLGVKQGLDVLLDAAARLQNPKIRVVLCGEGARKGHLENRIRTESLKNVSLLPLQFHEKYQELLADTNLSVITEQPGVGHACFPSKLLGIIAAGRPVLTVADDQSELTQTVAEGGFGVTLSPGDAGALAASIEELAGDPERLKQFSQAGSRFLADFEFGRVLGDFTRVLGDVVKQTGR